MTEYSTYKITNLINNKIYIGQTKTGIRKRWNTHIQISKNSKSKCFQLLHKAMIKYSSENFTIEIIESFQDYEKVINSEIYWINFYKTNVQKYGSKYGYNLTSGGEGKLDYKLSKETKNKIRDKAIGRKASQTTKDKFSKLRQGEGNGMFGNFHTEKSKKLMSKTKKKLGKTKGIKNPKAKLTEEMVKKIKLLLKEGVKQKDIANLYGVYASAIQKIASGKNWSHITID